MPQPSTELYAVHSLRVPFVGVPILLIHRVAAIHVCVYVCMHVCRSAGLLVWYYWCPLSSLGGADSSHMRGEHVRVKAYEPVSVRMYACRGEVGHWGVRSWPSCYSS